MPFDGSGNFTRLMNWVADAAAGIKIKSDRHDQEDDNFAQGLSNVITKDGQTVVTANIPFNNKRLTGLADGVNPQDAATKAMLASVVGGAHIADTPPATAGVGSLWWESDAGNLFVKYDDGTSTQWVQVNIAPPKPNIGSPFKRNVLTVTTTGFQYDPSTLFADVEVVGAGASGGASIGPTSGAGLAVAGGGGGGGGYSKKLIQITDAIRAATKTITVGAAGAVGSNGNASAYSDGTNALTGNGGQVGQSASAWSALCNHYAGGMGGTASGGDVNVTGMPGEPGSCFGTSANGAAGVASGFGGTGGQSAFGGAGGRGACAGGVNSNQSLLGGSALYPGCGGGGSVGLNGGANPGYSSGGGGLVIITEYR